MQTHQLERTITSMEVAEMVEKSHNDVLKDIRRIVGHLGEGKSSLSYFIESTYVNSQNKELPCFLLTKKGCELYGTRMTGEKGTLFAIEYIERFNEMETTVKQQTLPTDPMEILSLVFKAQENSLEEVKVVKQDVEIIGDRVTDIEENTPIHPSFLQEISKKRLARVTAFLGGKNSQAYKNRSFRDSVYAEAAKDFKDRFKVNKYSLTLSKDIPSALKYFETWMPKEETLGEIRSLNSQIELLDD